MKFKLLPRPAWLLAGVFLSVNISANAGTKYDQSPEQISENCAAYMATFNDQIVALVSDTSKATYSRVFGTFDNHMTQFADSLFHDYLMQNVHTDEKIRKV